jgi:hypothetical protein
MVRKAQGMLPMLVELAQPLSSEGTSDLSRLMAVRALAVLGKSTGSKSTGQAAFESVFATLLSDPKLVAVLRTFLHPDLLIPS